MTSDSRTFLPSRVDSVKSGAFSPTVGGAAAANGSTAANAARDINARFKVITSLRNSAKTRRLRSCSQLCAESYAVRAFLSQGAGYEFLYFFHCGIRHQGAVHVRISANQQPHFSFQLAPIKQDHSFVRGAQKIASLESQPEGRSGDFRDEQLTLLDP